MSRIYSRTQELGMKMMSLKEKNMHNMDIWNNVQVYLGQSIANHTGDLYILNLCL